MTELIIYSDFESPRLEYTLQFIFEECFRINYRHSSDKNKIPGKQNIINYSDNHVPGSFHIIPSGLLKEKGIKQRDYRFSNLYELPVLFPVQGGDIPYDPFSAIFFMISRYEEYLHSEKDEHGRFMPLSGIQGRDGLLDFPVVNAWLSDFKEKLEKNFTTTSLSFPESRFIPTIDIDNPWAIRNKSFTRKTGGILKDLVKLKFSSFTKRIRVLQRLDEDPFYTYPKIYELHDGKLRVFILIGNKSRMDNQISPENDEWREIIKQLDTRYTTGIHPSYRSNRNTEILLDEKRMLEAIVDHEIMISRQHFLKLDIPDTYRNLLSSGINEDYSMGFAGQTGFRAGTNIPFYFYDMERELKTGLKIFPFALMDRTLKDYLGLKPEQAIQKIDTIVETVKKYGGNFISIWHNESIGNTKEWEGWSPVYFHLLKAAGTLNN